MYQLLRVTRPREIMVLYAFAGSTYRLIPAKALSKSSRSILIDFTEYLQNKNHPFPKLCQFPVESNIKRPVWRYASRIFTFERHPKPFIFQNLDVPLID